MPASIQLCLRYVLKQYMDYILVLIREELGLLGQQPKVTWLKMRVSWSVSQGTMESKLRVPLSSNSNATQMPLRCFPRCTQMCPGVTLVQSGATQVLLRGNPEKTKNITEPSPKHY